MKLKEGSCTEEGCSYFGPLLGKKCGNHYWKGRAAIKKESSSNSLKISETEEPETQQPIKPRKAIRPISKNRAEELKRYRRLRDTYFKEHPECEFPGCTSREIDLHHKRGRVGAFLTDKRWFCSLCRRHHNWVEAHPEEAQKMGLSHKRLDKFK